jgi:hypothetical protein
VTSDLNATLYSDAFFDELSAGSLTTARIILQELSAVVPIRSVVDVGCGVGPWLRAALELGVERAIGLDGDYVDRGRLLVEPSLFVPCNLEKDRLGQAVAGARFDLAMSLEVAEHLSVGRAHSFVVEFCELSDLFLFSAAIPGQGGTNHVNEQWPEYWAALFEERGCACFDVMRPRLWHREECEWWYLQNVFVFARRGTVAFEVASRLGAPVVERPMRLVHPRMLEHFGWRLGDTGSKDARSTDIGSRASISDLPRKGTRPAGGLLRGVARLLARKGWLGARRDALEETPADVRKQTEGGRRPTHPHR